MARKRTTGTAFLALYYGNTISSAKLVATTVEPRLVAYIARELLKSQPQVLDEILATVERGRRDALKLILKDAEDAAEG